MCSKSKPSALLAFNKKLKTVKLLIKSKGLLCMKRIPNSSTLCK